MPTSQLVLNKAALRCHPLETTASRWPSPLSSDAPAASLKHHYNAHCRFREALEAAVVVSVLLQLVEKMKMPQLKRHGVFGAKRAANARLGRAGGLGPRLVTPQRLEPQLLRALDCLPFVPAVLAVWIGALVGVAISIVIGIVFIALFYIAGEKVCACVCVLVG